MDTSELFKTTPDAIIITDLTGKVSDWNMAAEAIFDYSRDEAIGKSIADLIFPDDRREEHEKIQREASAYGHVVYESVRRKKDGSLVHVSASTKSIFDNNNNIICFLSAKKDVTSLKVARDAKLVETKYSHFLELTPDSIVMVNVTGRIVHVNAQAERTFGYKVTELIGQPIEILLPERFRKDHLKHRVGFFVQPRNRTMGAGLELYGLRKSGEEFPVEISISPIETDEGMMVMSAVRDITDRKKAEQKFRGLLESAPDAMVIVGKDGKIILVNSQTEKIFGYKREELLGEEVEILVPDRFHVNHRIYRNGFFNFPIARSMGAEQELFARRKDGTEFPVEISLSPLETEEGTLVTGAIRDITDRKKAEQKFKDLLESAPDAMVIVDRTGSIILVNSQALKLFGWGREELLGQQIEILIPTKFRDVHPQHRTDFFANPKVRAMGANLELLGIRKNGTEFPVEISLSPLETEDGLFVSSAIRDVTERKRFELKLQEASRLKSEFLASMSHELRTPLNAIIGFSEFLLDEKPGKLNGKQKEYLEDVLQSGRHLLNLINDVLDLSKVEAGKMELFPETFSVANAIEDAIAIVSTLAHEKQIDISKVLSKGNDDVTLDHQRFKQILFNLLSNAVKFTQEKGKVEIYSSFNNLDRLEIQVRDTGIGIKEEDLGRLFKEFQQLDSGTNRQYQGSGLGLALTKRFVELLQGSIAIKSELGKGSTFTINLPRVLDKSRAL
ncbi:PAS domain S-box protein [Leptospira inadai serovar Lyme str. 10]|uniref:histidine kinase n=2 Tax=Leptospira inadai serovar Lyme TaxID=293084 RepID=V6HB15_9LEPT|nr:PAS domain S-box protein [Leptospira inadai]EQA35708.1 PAS domain S-box protein [Leptospira inadai serovar Lyme str. 10]PNV76832.1 PAS domain-containing sensor histidine kinase [Leptospira inadai serovar Lyme]